MVSSGLAHDATETDAVRHMARSVTPVFRRQLPAYSPLCARAVSAGVLGMIGDSDDLRSSVSRALCDEYRARRALLVGSGTMALHLALAGVRATVANRPVALPAYSCYDVASAAEGADMRAVLYDIDERTLSADEASLRRALEHDPAAVVAAHLHGYPVQLDLISRLAREAGAVLIEDAAQSADATFDGVPLGSFGSVSVLSFGRGKGRTAGGGGALLSHDDAGDAILAWAAAQLGGPGRGAREVALLAIQWAVGRPRCYGLPASLPFLHLGETVYHPPRVPNAMSGASVRALSIALGAAEAEVRHRRALAERLLGIAARAPSVEPIAIADRAVPGYLRLPLRSLVPLSRRDREHMAQYGVAPGYPRSLDTLTPFRERIVNDDEALPGARALAESLFTLPTHSRVEPVDVSEIEGWLLGMPNGAEPLALVSRAS